MIDNKLVDVTVLSQKLCDFPIVGKLAYATPENFLGQVVDDYSTDAVDVCLLSAQAAKVLCNVQNELNKNNLSLLIYDAYRPLRAVKHFAKWFSLPVIDKFELERQSHNRSR